MCVAFSRFASLLGVNRCSAATIWALVMTSEGWRPCPPYPAMGGSLLDLVPRASCLPTLALAIWDVHGCHIEAVNGMRMEPTRHECTRTLLRYYNTMTPGNS